jgi:hypothetical protein
VPLSEHEQRLLEQIERALLAEDPKFASTVRAADPRHYARRRVILAALALALGIVLLVVGVASDITPGGVPVIGVLGFVVMLAATVWGAQTYRRASASDLGQSPRGKGGRESRGRGRRPTMMGRLEERWRRRTDDQG